MESNNHPESLTWGDIMDMEDPINVFEPGESSNIQEASSCLQHQRSQPPTQPAAQTPDQRGAGGRRGYQQHHQAPGRRQEGVRRENHHQAPRQGQERVRRENHHQAPGQRQDGVRRENHHQAPGQRGGRGRRGNNHHVPYNQGHENRPPQWLVENNLRNRIEELNTFLHQEREMRNTMQHQLDLSSSKIVELQERLNVETAAKQQLEGVAAGQHIRLLLTASNGPRTDNTPSPEEQVELQLRITSLKNQLQEEKLRAEEQEQEKQALKKELEEAKREAERKEVLHGEQLEIQTTQLQEKTRSCLELASKLKDQEEVSQALREEVEELREQRKHQESVTIEEPSLQTDNIQQDIEEVTPNQVQETTENIQMAPETGEEPSKMEKISLWRQFKKAVTPRCCRQYKQQRQHLE